MTPKTIENHLGRVYVKLGITSRRQLGEPARLTQPSRRLRRARLAARGGG